MTTKVGYWVTTALVAAAMGMGGVMDLLRPPELVAGMAHLGYPGYFLLILGAWKVGGALALLAPKLPLAQGVGVRGRDVRPDGRRGLARLLGRRRERSGDAAGARRPRGRVVVAPTGVAAARPGARRGGGAPGGAGRG